MINNDTTPKTPLSFDHLLNDESRALLEEHQLTLSVTKPAYCYPIKLPFRFAGVPAHFPFKREGFSAKDHISYHEIQDSDFRETDEETIKAVLNRLAWRMETTSFWAVYLYERDTPNKDGFLKTYEIDIKGLDASKLKFAGFAYRTKNGISPRIERKDIKEGRQTRTQKLGLMNPEQLAEWEANWRSSIDAALKQALIPIELWVNDMFLSLNYYDANDGTFIMSDNYCKDDAVIFNRRLKLRAGVIATNHRIGLNSYDLIDYQKARDEADLDPSYLTISHETAKLLRA